jgi:hypothetical protein
MTKMVTFHKPMRGMGNPALVPDDVARDLEQRGEIKPDPPSFPQTAAAKPQVIKPMVAADHVRRPGKFGRGRDLLNQTYLTK